MGFSVGMRALAMISAVRRFLGWLGTHEPVVLLGLAVIVASTWFFADLADEVVEGDTARFDEAVLLSFRAADDPAMPIGPRWLTEVGRDITALGGATVLMLVIVAVTGYVWLIGKHGAMWLILAATLGGWLISSLLKYFFARPRPTVVAHLAEVSTASFPSGHSMMSAVVYLTLGALLTRLVARPLVKLYILAIACVLTGLVGLSRVFLGVHYPTDVLAGWLAGLIWATLCWLVARWLQRRGQIELEETEGVDDG
jgi:undecaprenyl-diphosphatase